LVKTFKQEKSPGWMITRRIKSAMRGFTREKENLLHKGRKGESSQPEKSILIWGGGGGGGGLVGLRGQRLFFGEKRGHIT